MPESVADASGYAVIVHLAAERVKDLHILNDRLEECDNTHGQRTYQKLPRHMQRRAVSGNPKRLPRAIRDAHNKEGAPARDTKRPRRKYRSRPRDKVSTYQHRQQRNGNTWLETHVWHAKRFHMTRQWGYALPARATLKMYRPILRALNDRCVMQDQSFMCCVEVSGPLPTLLSGLRSVLSLEGQTRVNSEECLVSLQWANVTFYDPNRCPLGPICDADVVWLPSSTDNSLRKFWLWVHPSAYDPILQLLVTLFDLDQLNRELSTSSAETSSQNLNKPFLQSYKTESISSETNGIDTATSNIENKENRNIKSEVLSEDDSFGINPAENSRTVKRTSDKISGEDESDDDVPKCKKKRRNDLLAQKLSDNNKSDYTNAKTEVSLVCLKDTLNRFSLRGPETYNILKRVLVPTSVATKSSVSADNGHDKGDNTGDKSRTDINMAREANIEINHSVKSNSHETTDKNGNSLEITADKKLSITTPKKSKDMEDNTSVNNVASGSFGEDCLWWQKYYCSGERKRSLECNRKTWSGMEYATFSKNSVLPLLIRDPRFLLPRTKQKIDPELRKQITERAEIGPVEAGSPLFDASIRRSLVQTRSSDCDINKMRSKAGVPGLMFPISDSEARLPILLMLRSSTDALTALSAVSSHDNNKESSQSWDLIVPGGWGGSMWVSLIYSGAVPVGIDHQTHLVNEEITDPPAYLLPDTFSGQEYAQKLAEERRIAYFKMPPNKRPNYIKLGVQHPFKAPWKQLVKSVQRNIKSDDESSQIGTGFLNEVLSEVEKVRGSRSKDSHGSNTSTDVKFKELETQNTGVEDFCIMRSARHLKTLDYLCCRSGNRRRVFRGVVKTDQASKLRQPSKFVCEELADTLDLIKKTNQAQLVRVMITLIGKGTIEHSATICIPSKEDVEWLKRALTGDVLPSANFDDHIVEKPQCDFKEKERKDLKNENKKKLARLQRIRKNARRRVRDNYTPAADKTLTDELKDAVKLREDQHQDCISEVSTYTAIRDDLWLLPENGPLLQYSRNIIGYTTEANFSRVRGCAAGQGYVLTDALLPVCQGRLRRWSLATDDRIQMAFDDKTQMSSAAEMQGTDEIKSMDCDNDKELLPAKSRNVNQTKSSNCEDVKEPSLFAKLQNIEQTETEICKDTLLDIDLPLIQENGIVVLVRNSNTLQYRFGMLTLCVKQPSP